MIYYDDSQIHLPSTLDGLRNLLSTVPQRPGLLLPVEFDRLSASERAEYDARRIAYLSSGPIVQTPQLRAVTSAVMRALRNNHRRATGRTGVLVDGQAVAGKTTACLAAARQYWDSFVRQIPEEHRDDYIPIAFIDVPASATPKMLMERFMGFLGLPSRKSWTLEQMQQLVVQHLVRGRTRMVIVDEIQNLHHGNRAYHDCVDVLKTLSNAVPATFIYSGIRVQQGSIMHGDHGIQITGRFTPVSLTPFDISSKESRGQWLSTIATWEQILPLHGQQKGTLVKEAQYLYRRTGGKMGSLSNLLVSAAMDIIEAGVGAADEFITLGHLDAVPLDIAAQRFEAEQPAGEAPRMGARRRAA